MTELTDPLISASLGIDIGRVLMTPTHDDGRPDTSFISGCVEEALQIPASPGALEVISELVPRCAGRVWLVSKANERIEGLTRLWLQEQRFFERVGLPESHVRFCLRREDKRAHALELGLTHFIDDRQDVLQALRGVVRALFLFGTQLSPAPDWVMPVATWAEVRRALRVSA